MRVRELETMNRLLRTQLQDSAASFRAALETAQRYLQEGGVRAWSPRSQQGQAMSFSLVLQHRLLPSRPISGLGTATAPGLSQ